MLVGFVFKYRMKKEEEEDGWRPLLPSNEGFETGKKERRVCVEATVQRFVAEIECVCFACCVCRETIIVCDHI